MLLSLLFNFLQDIVLWGITKARAMDFVDEVPIANEVTHVATKERRDDVLIMLEEAALLLRRHRAAEFG